LNRFVSSVNRLRFGVAAGQVVSHKRAPFQYRLFCLLEPDDAKKKLGGPTIAVIEGGVKAFRTTFSKQEYAAVRRLGDEYLKRTPRSVLR
jgi:hypothetical protein